MRAFILIAVWLLVGCGDARLEERESQTPVGELANEGSYAVSGRSNIRLYAADKTRSQRSSGELPIVITDGESFAAQIDGSFSGETIYAEIDGVVRAIVIDAKAGKRNLSRLKQACRPLFALKALAFVLDAL
jgi:hypothetical protein